VKALGDEEPWLDDTAAWVERSRKLAKEKELAEKRVRIDPCGDNQMASFVSLFLYLCFYFVLCVIPLLTGQTPRGDG